MKPVENILSPWQQYIKLQYYISIKLQDLWRFVQEYQQYSGVGDLLWFMFAIFGGMGKFQNGGGE